MYSRVRPDIMSCSIYIIVIYCKKMYVLSYKLYGFWNKVIIIIIISILTKSADIFVEKMREAFALHCQNFSHVFNKNISKLQIITFEILTKRLKTTSLVFNNRAQIFKSPSVYVKWGYK